MSDLRQAIRDGTFEQFRQADPRCRLGPRTEENSAAAGESDPVVTPEQELT
jgi:hypothetical protein